MKTKKLLTYILTGALCCSMLAGLAGCGGKTGGSAEDPAKQGGAAAETPAPEYVYAPEYVDVKGELDSSFDSMIFHDGRFLASLYTKIGERELREGEELTYEGQLDVWGQKLYWLGLDGSLEEVAGYEPLPAPAEGDGGSYVQRLMLSPAGDIVTLEMAYRSWYDGPDDVEMYTDEWYQKGYAQYQHNEQHAYLRTLNPDGTEKSIIDLDSLKEDLPEDDYFYISDMQMDGAGRFYCTQDQTIFILDAEGKPIGKIQGEDWFDQLLAMDDGSVAAVYWGGEGEQLAVIDPDKAALGEGVKVPSSIYNRAQNLAGAYDICYTDGSNLMGYSFAEEKAEKILNWVNCDVDNSNTRNTFILPDGRIATMEYEWDKDYTHCDARLVLLSKVPASSVPQKTVLTFATQDLDYQTRSAIINFNRKNDTYRIELRDYSEYNSEDDWSAGLTKLLTEIMAGNVPDILDLNGLPVEKLAAQGLLADLYPLLDGDAELSRDSIFPNILEALDQDGHLYRTASGFEVITVVGARSVVGPGPGWTLADFKKALAGMPEGCQPFSEYTTRNSILNQMLSMAMGELVDWETGKCYFDSPVFRDILEFAAQFPETYEWDEERVWTEEDDEPNRIAAGRQMLQTVYLEDFNTIQMYNAMFGGEASFIGFPVSEGVGSALQISEGGYAVSAKCAEPDAAWQFVRTAFTEDYQIERGWGFPTNKKAFDARLKEAMTPEYEKDASGNFILDENGQKKEISRGGWGWGSMEVEFYALTQAEADQIMGIIRSTTRVIDSDDELMNIILEDTQAYFAGQKSLDDVVRQLQSKMNIYINEQR